MRLVLASASPSRRRLLRLAGIEPEVRVSDVDEDAVAAAAGPLTPGEYVQLLAAAKAEAVVASLTADTAGEVLVIGCDSAFELDGRIYGKPHEPEIAAERWRAMRGRTGVLHTGHRLIDPVAGGRHDAVVSTAIEFADVTDDEIAWYVATGEPLPVAGAFTLDGLAAAFISRIDGDPHAVVGLSIATLRRLVTAAGHDWRAIATTGGLHPHAPKPR